MNNLEEKKRKVTLNQIISLIIILPISALVIYSVLPYTQNFLNKVSGIDLYQYAYRATYTSLTKLDRPEIISFASFSSSKNQAQLEVSNIGFGISEDDQKNLQTNDYKVSSRLENLNTSLRIKSAQIDGKVVDGKNEEALTRGFWFLPISAEPGEIGNTVIIGHRFLKIPPYKDTFFSLDKVGVGDQIEIIKAGEKISYTVIESKIINPTQREVIHPTNDYRLTLITCAPLWENTKRLVVVALQDEAQVVY